MRTLLIALFVLLAGCGGRAGATDSERVAGEAGEPAAPPEVGGEGSSSPTDVGARDAAVGAPDSDRRVAVGNAAASAQEPPGGAGGLAGAVGLPGVAEGASEPPGGGRGGAVAEGAAGAGGLAGAPIIGGSTATGGALANGGAEPATGGLLATGGAVPATGGTVAVGGAPPTCDGVTCTGGQQCEAGVCVCPSSAEAYCLLGPNWTCVNILASDEHCGACGNSCAADQTCWAGACTGGSAVLGTGGAGGQGGAADLGGAGGWGGAPTECVCTDGPCCDGCNHLPWTRACLVGDEVPDPVYPETPYGPWQSWCRTSTGSLITEYRNVYCSGESAECDGRVGDVTLTTSRSCWCVGDTAPGTDVPSHAACDD